jgi:hypothetical protein
MAQRVESAVRDAVTRSLYSVTSEPGPYRFTGLQGESLVRDLATTSGWSAGESREVDAAFDRLRKFERWSQDTAALVFAPQTTSTASEVIPPGYRAALTIPLTADWPLFNRARAAADPERRTVQHSALRRRRGDPGQLDRGVAAGARSTAVVPSPAPKSAIDASPRRSANG